MPVMDGFETTARIRERFDSDTLPIIAMTAYAMPGDRQQCLDMGMNGHIAKPVDFVLLEEVLAQYLPLVVTTQPEIVVPQILRNNSEWQQHIVLLDKLLQRKSLDVRKVFAEVQSSLIEYDADQTHELAQALAKLDFKQAQSVLHSMVRTLEIKLD